MQEIAIPAESEAPVLSLTVVEHLVTVDDKSVETPAAVSTDVPILVDVLAPSTSFITESMGFKPYVAKPIIFPIQPIILEQGSSSAPTDQPVVSGKELILREEVPSPPVAPKVEQTVFYNQLDNILSTIFSLQSSVNQL